MAGFLRTGKRRHATTAITILPSGRTLQVESGTSVLSALLVAGEHLAHQCGGQSRCGSCHVFVFDGGRGLSKMRRNELDRLASLEGAGIFSRLACQAILGTHAITIQLIG